jgi:flavin-binding protein dodecin
MTNHIYKSVDITGTSPEGVTEAISNAVNKASKTLRHIGWFEVENIRGYVDDTKLHYQVSLKIGFRLED